MLWGTPNSFSMSDWDVFAPVTPPAAAAPGESLDEPADGVFFRDDNDDSGFTDASSTSNFGSVLSQQPQSLSACKISPSGMRAREMLKPRPKNLRVSFDQESHSYCDKKIHTQSGDIMPAKLRGGSRRRRNGGFRRDVSDTADISITSISHELLKNGFAQEKYDKLHTSAVEQRRKSAPGKSSDMNSLFYFWCYYLRQNFDRGMYDEFLRIAREDAAAGSHYGIECFFRFCSYGLETNFSADVFADFQREALDDFRLRGSKYGLEKLRGFLVHQKLETEPKLTEEVAEVMAKFPTIESFQDGRQVRARSIPKENRFLASDAPGERRGGARGRGKQARGAGKTGGRGKQGNRKSHPSSVPNFESSPMKK